MEILQLLSDIEEGVLTALPALFSQLLDAYPSKAEEVYKKLILYRVHLARYVRLKLALHRMIRKADGYDEQGDYHVHQPREHIESMRFAMQEAQTYKNTIRDMLLNAGTPSSIISRINRNDFMVFATV